MKELSTSRDWFCSITCMLVGLFSLSLHASEQVIPAHPRAELEIKEVSEDDEPINFILSSAQRIRNEVTFERAIKVFGSVSSNTYRMPSDLKRLDTTDWFKQQITSLGGEIEFECEQRDCGRATIWASDIFGERVLSASDVNQNYLAVALEKDDVQYLLMIYVVERSNRRVYAHVVEILPSERVAFDAPVDVSSELLRRGTVTLPDVVPDSQGTISTEDLESLRTLAETELQEFVDEEIYVVCHVNGPNATEELLEYSRGCAEQIQEVFEDQGLNVVPFGNGPLSPIEQTPVSRVELVIPRLLKQELE
ncbi:MAG: DUF4892 domain-containing protein [Gammaproteobacteria bacterium]|nr:DUF4892 domain-containing protein [Gammaproteobacteria bacterium]MYF01843.1 DUF4892 domain-containing protein [Gammaproteobacteria bacterium]MYI76904.1 DUF4892 domain-containing protein [Gammaproteobacteria bacterium]